MLTNGCAGTQEELTSDAAHDAASVALAALAECIGGLGAMLVAAVIAWGVQKWKQRTSRRRL